MAKTCNASSCIGPVFSKGFCRFHQYLRNDKKAKRIRQFSIKRERINRREYQPQARQFVIDNPVCNIRSPVCSYHAECVNHRKGKDTIKLLLDMSFWEASCFLCNNWIEANHQWAVDRGHKLSRLTIH
ncbi:hypothetical protein SAMN05216311_114171 [Chitinophaga sp. CF418]|nr:hypothetical protein SAMN05216311_114171 [Chitinophaga sp. CF418]